MTGAAKHSFFAPDPSAPISEEPFAEDRELWSDANYGASIIFSKLIQDYRHIAGLGRKLRASHPDHESMKTIKSLLRQTNARIRARLQSYAPTDRQRRNPH